MILPARLKKKQLSFDLIHDGNTLTEGFSVSNQERVLVPFSLKKLPQGRSEITCLIKIDAGAWQHDGQITIAVVNTSSSIREMELSLAHSGYSDTVYVPFENRTILMDSGSITEPIKGLDTRVYQFSTGSKDKSGIKIDPGNLTTNPSFERNLA